MEIALATAACMGLGALLYLVTCLPIANKRGWSTMKIVARGVMVMFLFGGIGAQLGHYGSFEPVYTPLDSWLRISELGYIAIWLELGHNLGAFVPFGMMLPFAFGKLHTTRSAVVAGVVASAFLGASMLFAGCFVTDAVWQATAGTVAGFALIGLIGWILPRFKPTAALRLSKRTHSIGVFYLLFIYFVGVGALLLDNGSVFVPLNIFSPEQRLPASITFETDLAENTTKVMTYETIKTNLKTDAQNVALACNIAGEPELTGQRAIVTQASKSVTLATSGEWKYVDTAVRDGDVPDELAKESALRFLSNGLMGNFSVTDITVSPIIKEQKTVGKQVYLEIGIGGKRVKGSCEVIIEVGEEGQIKTADKHSAYFQEYKKVSAISAREAMNRALAGQGGHTLFSPAQSAVITQAQSAYWLEEVKGILQPIWLFGGTATLADGTQEYFEIYVPAIK